jgi:hypothetical protein
MRVLFRQSKVRRKNSRSAAADSADPAESRRQRI